MKKRLLLIGGGHAHMVTLAQLDQFVAKGYEVTVIQPSPYHYYSGMGPGMLGGTYEPDDIRFGTRQLVEAKGGHFVLGKAKTIDPEKQLVYLEGDAEEPLSYDVLSCNAGSNVPETIVTDRWQDWVFGSKPIEELQRAKEMIRKLSVTKKLSLAVLGSGPSSIEIAGNLHQLAQEENCVHEILLFSGRTFMSKRPARVQHLCRSLLEKKGVKIIEGGYVKNISQHTVTLENGMDYHADVVFSAIGVMPSSIFASSGLTTGPDGGLQVNSFLQSVDYPNIFGGGDCIYFEDQPLDKVGVYAVRQNPILFHNLMAALDNSPLKPFSPGGKYLLIYNLGGGDGVFSKWSLTFSGKLAFKIKDYIDRKFIATFQ